MELTELRYFLNVASVESFSGGAKLSHVSPPAISKAIAKLEEELGTGLFTRTTRRVTLTPAGELLRARCTRLFEEIDGIRRDVEDVDAELKGPLRVGAMEVFSIHLLPVALSRLVRRHPRLVPFSHELHPERIGRLLAEGKLDVGFTIGASAVRGVEQHAVGRSAGVLVCGKGHELHRRARVSAAALPMHPFVAPRTLGLEHLPALDQFPEERFPRTIGATIELLQMGLELAAQGAYLGFFPEICVRGHVASKRLRVVRGISFGVTFDLVALTRAGQKPTRAVLALIDEVRAALAHVERGRGASNVSRGNRLETRLDK